MPERLVMRLNEADGDPVAAWRKASLALLGYVSLSGGIVGATALIFGGVDAGLLPKGALFVAWPMLLASIIAVVAGSVRMSGHMPLWLRTTDAALWFVRLRHRLKRHGLKLDAARGLPRIERAHAEDVDVYPMRGWRGFHIELAVPSLAGLTLWSTAEASAVPRFGVRGPARCAICALTAARRATLDALFADGGVLIDGVIHWSPSRRAAGRGVVEPVLRLAEIGSHATDPINSDPLQRVETNLDWRIACMAAKLASPDPATRRAAIADAEQAAEPIMRLAARIFSPHDPIRLPALDDADDGSTARLGSQIALTVPALGLGSPATLAALGERIPGARRCVLHALRALDTPPDDIAGATLGWLPADGPLLVEIAQYLGEAGTAETLDRLEALPRPLPTPLAQANARIRGRLYPDGGGGLALAHADGGQLALATDSAGGLTPIQGLIA